MPKFRKKPVVIEAFQLPMKGSDVSEDFEDALITFLRSAKRKIETSHQGILIHTSEGVMRADPGDWIIKGVAGEFYPCKPDIFEKTYESVPG